jgi:hypothetical protein
MTMKDNAVEPQYMVGQKVIIRPVSEQSMSQRENDINLYAGQVGDVSNYYWMNPPSGQVFYIYNVRVGENRKEIAVYEDEIEACLS